MKQDTKVIIEMSLQSFVYKVQEAILQGFMIDQNHPPSMWGMAYEVGMVRTDKTATKLAEHAKAVVEGKPKLTRAEILMKAREARAAKKSTEKAHESV